MGGIGTALALLAALTVSGTPGSAHAQVFLASRPRPEFRIAPLFVQASVTPALGPVVVEVLWSLMVPPGRSGLGLAQDLYLLWPGSVAGNDTLGPPDSQLARYVEARGFTVINEGRLSLLTQSLYQTDRPAAPVEGGAPFATFVRESGPLGITAAATYIRIPWTPALANPVYLTILRMTINDLIRPKRASWVERVFTGQRYAMKLSFHDVHHQALFPLYVEHRNRVVSVTDDASELLINFADADHLKINEVVPSSSNRRLSETLESTMVVSLSLAGTNSLTPQTLSVQFGYFRGVQAWAPVLIPILFFALGNAAAPLVRGVVSHAAKRVAARVQLGRRSETRETGVILPTDALARITPGETTYEEVIRLCGPDVEERQQLHSPGRRILVYRGRRVAPQRGRTFGWLATVRHWDAEEHEVEIAFERDRVRDVQAAIRRSRLASPDSGWTTSL